MKQITTVHPIQIISILGHRHRLEPIRFHRFDFIGLVEKYPIATKRLTISSEVQLTPWKSRAHPPLRRYRHAIQLDTQI
jgi:hypothetical protein